MTNDYLILLEQGHDAYAAAAATTITIDCPLTFLYSSPTLLFSSLTLQLVLTAVNRERCGDLKHLLRDFSAILADWNIFVEL